MRDYLNNFQFLNAYKHGLRVENKGKSTLSIQKSNRDVKWEKFVECDSTISYLECKKTLTKNQKEVVESQIWFDKSRIIVKCKYLLGILKKARGEAIKDRDYSKILSSEDKNIVNNKNNSLKFNSPRGMLNYNK